MGAVDLCTPDLAPAVHEPPALLGGGEHAAVSVRLRPDVWAGGVLQPDPERDPDRPGRRGGGDRRAAQRVVANRRGGGAALPAPALRARRPPGAGAEGVPARGAGAW